MARVKLPEKWNRALDLPREVSSAVPRLTLVGRDELLLENHRGILAYSDREARFLTAEGAVKIEGESLILSEFTEDTAFVCGRLTSWRFEDGI